MESGRYRCSTCGKQCADLFSLTEHVRVHGPLIPSSTPAKFLSWDAVSPPFQCVEKVETDNLYEERTKVYSSSSVGKECWNLVSHAHKPELPVQYISRKQLYQCHICKTSFKEQSSLRIHSSASNGKWQCMVCDKTFCRNDVFEKHSRMHAENAEGMYRPSFQKLDKSVEEAVDHNKKDGINQCWICSQIFPEELYYTEHFRRSHPGKRPFICKKCGDTFNTKLELSKHALYNCNLNAPSVSGESRLTGSNRSMCHPNRQGVQDGMEPCRSVNNQLAAEEAMEYSDEDADFSDNSIKESPGELRKGQTLLKRSEEGAWQCYVCEDSFHNFASLQSHISLHSSAKLIKCQTCSECFDTQLKYAEHTCRPKYYSENPEMPVRKGSSVGSTSVKDICYDGTPVSVELYKCENCETHFKNAIGLRMHRLKSKGWHCWVCGEKFCTRPSLQNHFYLHPNEKPFKCLKCSICFDLWPMFFQHVCKPVSTDKASESHVTEEISDDDGSKPLLDKHVCHPTSVNEDSDSSVMEDTVDEDTRFTDLSEGNTPTLETIGFNKCPICQTQFKNGAGLANHRRISMGWQCWVCDEKFCNLSSLQSHFSLHPGKKPFKCQKCSDLFNTWPKLKEHVCSPRSSLSVYEGPGSHDVTSELSDANSKPKDIASEVAPGNVNLHKCEVCEIVFKNGAGLSAHSRHSKGWQCWLCNQQFCSVSGLQTHFLLHPGQKPFICMKCKATFSSKMSVDEHVCYPQVPLPDSVGRVKSEVECWSSLPYSQSSSYSCWVCNHVFASENALNIHFSIHPDKFPFKCNECGQVFSSDELLLEHQKSHTNNKCITGKQHFGKEWYMCAKCKGQFADFQKYELHTMHCKGKWSCWVCEENLCTFESLIDHFEAVHPNKRPLKCRDCDATFKTYGHLKSHNDKVQCKPTPGNAEITLVPQVYECKKCHVRCKNVEDYGSHLQSSEYGTGKWICWVCKCEFCKELDYFKHVRNHPGIDPLQCRHCCRNFSTQDEMVRHMQVHPQVLYPDGDEFSAYDNEQNTEDQEQSVQEDDPELSEIEGKQMFHCKTCNSTFNYKIQLDVHMRRSEIWHCRMCRFTTCGMKLIQKHFKLKHPAEKVIKCNLCGEGFNSKYEETIHHEKEHNCEDVNESHVNYYGSEGQPSMKKVNIDHDIKSGTTSKEELNQCDKCGCSFKLYKDYCNHKRIGKGNWQCWICQCNVCTKKQLVDHVTQIHPGAKPWKCNLCEEMFTQQSQVIEHRKKHSSGTGAMDMLEQSSTERSATYELNINTPLGMHKESTCDKMLYECHRCTTKFDNHKSYNLHVKKSKRDWQCWVCKLEFCTMKDLVNHFQVHPNVNPFKCSFCEKSLASLSAKIFHLKTHQTQLIATLEKGSTGIMQPPAGTSESCRCWVCQQYCATDEELMSHFTLHPGKSPYNCTHCGEMFSERNELTGHKLMNKEVCSGERESSMPMSSPLSPMEQKNFSDVLADKRYDDGSGYHDAGAQLAESNDECDETVDFEVHADVKDEIVIKAAMEVDAKEALGNRLGLFDVCAQLDESCQQNEGQPLLTGTEKILGQNPPKQQNYDSFHHCLLCNKTYPRRKTHWCGKMSFCVICNTNFSNVMHFSRHNKETHPSQKPFLCADCDKSFRTYQALYYHRCYQCRNLFPSAHEKSAYAKPAKILTKKPSYIMATKEIRVNRVKKESPIKMQTMDMDGSENPAKMHQCSFCQVQYHTWQTHWCKSKNKCRICEETFDSVSHYAKHVRKEHRILRPFHCEDCSGSFGSMSGLHAHRKKLCSSVRRVRRCRICEEISGSLSDYIIHFRKEHPSILPFQCDKCSTLFQSASGLYNHGQKGCNTVGNKIFKCRLCDKTCYSVSDYIMHFRQNHSPFRPFQCDDCCAVFESVHGLHVHQKSNCKILGENVVRKCYICGDEFLGVSVYLKHFKQLHPDQKPYHCVDCNRTFSNGASLQNHRNKFCMKPDCFIIGSRGRPIKNYTKKCRICGGKFLGVSLMDHFLKMHPGCKPFECDKCFATYKYPQGLWKHKKSCKPEIHCKSMAEHDRNGNVPVKIELKREMLDSELSGTRISISPENDPRQVELGTSDQSANVQIRNSPVASGNAIYQCTACAVIFPTRAGLANHQSLRRVKWECWVCKKELCSALSVVMHFQLHPDEKPFRCPGCHNKYASDGSYSTHLSRCTLLRSQDNKGGERDPSEEERSSDSATVLTGGNQNGTGGGIQLLSSLSNSNEHAEGGQILRLDVMEDLVNTTPVECLAESGQKESDKEGFVINICPQVDNVNSIDSLFSAEDH